MESSTYPYKRPLIPEGKFYFYSTCSPDLFLNGIEVELKMTYNPQQCKTYLKSQLRDKIGNIGDYDLLVYLSGGIPFLGGTIGDMYSSTSEVHFKRYIYGILTRPISEKELNANYSELCNINDKTRKILISPICESTENGLIDMACILGYLNHGGLLSDKFLRCCSIVTHFPPLITCLNRILMQNEITGRDVITVTSSLFTFFSSLVRPFPNYDEVFNYAIMCCNYIIDIKVENETFPLISLMNNNDSSVKFLMNLNQPKVVYFWEDDECGNKYEDFVYYRLEPFDLLEFKKVNPIFISFTPIPPLSIRNAFGCSIVKGKKHNYLYLSKSPLTTKIQGNNIDIINPKTGIIKSIDIDNFAAKQNNNEIINEFNLIDPEKVSQIMIICLDSSKSMSLTLEGSKMANSETRSLIAIQYLSTFTQKIIDYKIQSIQGLINFNSKIEFSSQFSPLSDKILKNALSNMKTTSVSFIWDALSFACDEIVKFTLMEANKFKNAVKRILVLSSSEDQGSNIPFIDVVKKLIDNKIIVDSLIFNNEEKGKQMCALCHMTGGFSFNITTVNDGLFIVENSTFLNHIPQNKIRIPHNLTIDFIQKIVSSSKFDTKIQNEEAKRVALEKRFATPRCICSRFTKVDNLHTRRRRILKELYLASLKIDQSTNPDNDGSIVILPFASCIDIWSVFLKGVDGTLYEKKWFNLFVTFPELYPIEPPVIRFLQIPYNLNVSPDGRVCIDALNDGYLPSMHVIDIIYYIKEIFIIPDIEYPAQIAIYETFKNNINSYEKNVHNSVLQVGKDDYKEFFTEGTKIDDSISEDLMKDHKELVPSYIKPKIMEKLMKDPVLASSGVYYEREELKQLIASHINPICVVTGKSLTEKISDIDDICPSKEKFHKNYFETKVKSENDIKSENLMKTTLIDQTDFYKLIKFKEDKSGEFYAAMVFYQNIENYSKKKRKIILKWLNKMVNINYPSIIKSIKFDKECSVIENQLTLFTEFVDQISLRNIIFNSSIKLTDTQKFIIIFGIASAMSYLHSYGILHRDLTTENVFVDRNFYPKLTNIDMINIFKGLKSMKRILNLSFYQAPEFYFENKYSKLSDVYSFALMVYEILSNENLFIKISFTNHLENMKNMWRPSLDKKIPEAYHSLINKCWSQIPSERPSFEMILNLLKLDVKQKIKNFEIDKFNDYINIVDSSQKETKEGNSSNENVKKNTKTKIKKDDDDDGNNEEEESKKDGDDEDDVEESIKDGYEEEEEEFFEEEELNEFEKKICEDLLLEKVNRINIKLYKNGKIIDNGGFGIVYKAAKIKEKQRKFAAKVFSLRNSYDDPKIYKNFCETFMNEMILHSSFSHPSVVKFIGYSPLNFTNADNRHKPLMMMDFVQKGSLHSIIQKVKKGLKIEGWDDTKRLMIIYGIAASMSYLHSKDILHRDLKLRNVLIDDGFYPKLTDFGLSIEISKISGEKEKCVKGTANYIAPEIWKDINYSKSSDVYSFAILVYELVTNNFLFENARDEFICYQITIGKFRPKIDNRKISKSYIQLINLCWSDDANERPSFDSILKMLKEDDGFTKDNVDVVAFKEYISFIDKHLNSSNI